MSQVVAPVAALFVVGDNSRQHLALVIPNIMRRSVPVVDVQPLYHLCLVKTARFTVVNVISHSELPVLPAVMTRVAIAMVVVVVGGVMVGTVIVVIVVITVITVITVIVVITVIAGKTPPGKMDLIPQGVRSGAFHCFAKSAGGWT